MRLIDADALEKEIRSYAKTLYQNIKHSLTKDFQPSRDFCRGVEDGYCRILSALQAQPTIDPAKRGKWIIHHEVKNIYGGTYIECSECGEKYVVQYIEDEKFCRNCGARMEGEEDG